MLFIANDVKNKLKKSSPIVNNIFPTVLVLFLKNVNVSPIIIMYEDIFSIFIPIMNEVIVVAILLPSIIPILLLKVSSLAFIKLIVSIITAELDCISDVVINPVLKLLNVVEVIVFSFCFTLFRDNKVKLLLR